MDEHRRFRAESLREAVAEALAREGVPPHVREVEAELMVEAELHGVPSHGLLMLPRLVVGLRERRANPDPQIRLVRDSAAVCVLDGDRGPGRYVGVQGMRTALERAGRFGIGACLVIGNDALGPGARLCLPGCRRGICRPVHDQRHPEHARAGQLGADTREQPAGHRGASRRRPPPRRPRHRDEPGRARPRGDGSAGRRGRADRLGISMSAAARRATRRPSCPRRSCCRWAATRAPASR